jgi:hypothetical protein
VIEELCEMSPRVPVLALTTRGEPERTARHQRREPVRCSPWRTAARSFSRERDDRVTAKEQARVLAAYRNYAGRHMRADRLSC